MPHPASDWKTALATVALAAFCVGIFMQPVRAATADKYAQVDPAISAWVSQLQPQGSNGQPGGRCCDLADGLILQDTQWEYGATTYRVFLVAPDGWTFPNGSSGQWVDVPPEAVVVEPNKLGHALVWVSWTYSTGGHVDSFYLRCFLPGAGL